MEKSWKNESRHETFESADQRRNSLLEKKIKGLLVKVKLMRTDNRFVVKTWSPPVQTKSDQNNKNQSQKGHLKTRAQRRALRERRKKDREATN